jgi:propanol-preferring alcohol dehydrogenase
MRAMVPCAPRRELRHHDRPDPAPGAGEVRIRVEACAGCRTELHIAAE